MKAKTKCLYLFNPVNPLLEIGSLLLEGMFAFNRLCRLKYGSPCIAKPRPDVSLVRCCNCPPLAIYSL